MCWSFWITSAKLANWVIWPMLFHQIVGSKYLFMQQSPSEKSAFGFRLCFPYRQQFQLTKGLLELDTVSTLGCIFSIFCPPPNNGILPAII
jgi:hypothetical protein